MANSIKEPTRRRRLRLSRFLVTQTSSRIRTRAKRTAIFAVLVVGVMVYGPAQHARLLRSTVPSQDCPQPGAKIDVVFILDTSGSFDMKLVGQSYNVQIDGVLRVLRDPSVIPRDGSIAIAVETFAGSGTIQIPLKQIDTSADAEAIAKMVESLRCNAVKCTSNELCPVFGSNPASNYAPAINNANDHLNGMNGTRRPGARQALLLSSDGQPSDLDFAAPTAQRVGKDATDQGFQFEIDLILLAQQAPSCSDSNAGINNIVFPQPACDLPGAVLAIERGDCNKPCASLDDSAVKADCDRQVKEFAELTHRVLRSQPATRFLTVTTVADPAEVGKLSLRQAIEFANGNGGATTITFDAGLKGLTIHPPIPLPALTAPDIVICGCNENNCAFLIKDAPACAPFLTIDGSLTDTTKGEQHSDGILIRSDRDVIRGLRIINFAGAGVSVNPVCNGLSRIEGNVFENNKKAGVRVIESPSNPGRNVGNTILGNTILDSAGCATPIDLGGDGRTDNDRCDADQGPNTLLNFPGIITVTTANNVTVRGSVCDPTCGEAVCPPKLIGAVVEIFAVTKIGTNCAAGPANGATALQSDPDNRVITGVMPLARGITDTNGLFTLSGLADSPTCGYTATVTDLEGNTSELSFPGVGFAKAKTTNLDFKKVEPNDRQSGTFTIENTGFAPLAVSFASIRRDDFPQNKPSQLARSDDSAHFSIESIIVGSGGQTITIQPGQAQIFTAMFDAAIPRVFKGKIRDLPASLVLPDTVNSTITLVHNGCLGSDKSVSLTGHVSSAIKLIDPDNPRSDPLILLNRSGDVLTVDFSIYDSALDVDSVIYEFFDQSGGSVELNQPDRDLSHVIDQARAAGTLRIGQSLSLRQTFTNAKQHRNVATVTVTVFDKQHSSDKASGSIVSSTSIASGRSLLNRGHPLLALPVGRFEIAADRKARRAEGSTGSIELSAKKMLVRSTKRSQIRERRIAND